MKCMYCGNYETYVIETRSVKNDTVIRRRRECNECKRRFTTYEIAKVDKK